MSNKIISYISAFAGDIVFSIYTREAKDRMVLDGEIAPCYIICEIKLAQGRQTISGLNTFTRADVQEFLHVPLWADKHTDNIRFHDWVKIKDLFQEYETTAGFGSKGYLIERIKS